MDFTELTESLKAKIADKEKLEEEKGKLEEALVSTLRLNYIKLFVPEYNELVELDELLRKATGRNFVTDTAEVNKLYYAPRYYVTNGLYYNGEPVFVGENKLLNSVYICAMSDVFLNTDTTLAFLDKVKTKIFTQRFRYYESCLDAQSKSLRDAIATLLDKLSETSSIKEHTDGTIEIMLNGKTYVGTVKEK